MGDGGEAENKDGLGDRDDPIGDDNVDAGKGAGSGRRVGIRMSNGEVHAR